MTTVAFDGKLMAADSLAVDAWGLRSECHDKILKGRDFLLGCSGSTGLIQKWWVKHGSTMDAATLIAEGFCDYELDKNDPSLMLVCRQGVYRHVSGVFLLNDRPFFAVGSGRDYALAALYLGANASHAVEVAAAFDINTGGPIQVCKFPF